MSATKTMDAAITRLIDIEAIKQLKARYCYFVDDGQWDELENLWTEDAVCDYGFFGRFQGRRAIMDDFFRGLVSSASTFNAHMLHNPLIEVENDVASASWYFTAHTTVNGRALLAMGRYRDRYAKVQGEWKIAAIAVEFKYYTPFEEGWAKTPMWRPA